MTVAASQTSPPHGPRRSWLRGLFESGLFIGLIIAGVGYLTERAKNAQATLEAQELAVRAQDLTRINAFQDSGMSVDQAFVAFEAALKNESGEKHAKEAFFRLARKHASQANELRSLIGERQTDRHLDALKSLQDAIRHQNDFGSYGDVRTALSMFVVTRNDAVQAAKLRPLHEASH